MRYDTLKEKALANFELLLDLWGLEWKDLGKGEYDFLAPTRKDYHFGACRFNVIKGRGADFAGTSECLTKDDYRAFGTGFDSSDFASYSSEQGRFTKSGFDVIGLCQRIYRIDSYQDAAHRIRDQLSALQTNANYIKVAKDAAEQRRKKIAIQNEKKKIYAKDIWRACQGRSLKGSPAEAYFNYRGIPLPDEANIRFHPGIKYYGSTTYLPCVLFNVQVQPDGPQVALHRIYIRKDGKGKADVPNAKMALAQIGGAGIWFGRPGSVLVVVEGPENALVVLTKRVGYTFSVCSISATNISSLKIPEYVKEVVLIPDEDNAGEVNCQKAIAAYLKQGKKVHVEYINWEALCQKKKT